MEEENLNFPDCFELSTEEKLNLIKKAEKDNFSNRAKYSRALVAKKDKNIDKSIAKAILECTGIRSALRILHQYNKYESTFKNITTKQFIPDDDTWERVMCDYLRLPDHFRNPLFFLVYHAAVDAQTHFCFDSCRAPSREETLTGELLAHFKRSLRSWSDVVDAYLEKSETKIELSSVDLQLGGLEQKTGGDFCIILELDDNCISKSDQDSEMLASLQKPRGGIIVPLVFQAKRYRSQDADISQTHHKNGLQYDVLKRIGCSSAYIFYNNEKNIIDNPAIPMVKPVRECKDPSVSKSTPVFKKSVDFASYILQAISDHPSIKSANSREDALRMILPGIEAGRLNKVVVVSSKSGAGPDYEKLLKQLHLEEDDPDEKPEADLGPDF